MAYDRISRDTAERVALPGNTWYVRTPRQLLMETTVWKNIPNVPINTPLLESVSQYGIKAPLLVMPNWYPIVGSQRLRACFNLFENNQNHPVLDQPLRVCRFDKEWWNCFYLWGDTEFRDKAVAIWFQTVELAWKSQYYIEETDPNNTKMTEFEKLGDELPWKHKGLDNANFYS